MVCMVPPVMWAANIPTGSVALVSSSWPVEETEKNVPQPRPLEIRKALEVWEKWQPTGFQ